MDFTVPEFDIERNRDRCTLCGACVKECSYKVHFFSKDKKAVLADERKCVACHRCAVICPSHAIKIVKYDMAYRDHANWTPTAQKEIIKQATTGGVLLSGMSNNKPYPIYWDKMLLNASQVTNPSIDPLR
jgi:NAD-dependent dihydropyrimidine dehydrogenase PreA subunit